MENARRGRASVWWFVTAGILLGGCVGAVLGYRQYQEGLKRPDEIFGHAFDLIVVVLGATGGAAAGAALGALVGALVLGGLSAACWVLGSGVGLGVGLWLFMEAMVAAERGFDLLGMVPLAFLAVPALVGTVASWAVRRSRSRRSGFGRDSRTRP